VFVQRIISISSWNKRMRTYWENNCSDGTLLAGTAI
jgi:hypothetical protein